MHGGVTWLWKLLPLNPAANDGVAPDCVPQIAGELQPECGADGKREAYRGGKWVGGC